MKKYLFLLSALALLGLTSCEVPEINPNYDPVTNSVLTNFVFNVSTSNEPQTKMTSANTQAALTDAFRGITNAEIISYKLGTSNDGKIVEASTTPTAGDQNFSMGTVLYPGTLDPSGTNNVDKSRRVVEIPLPLETNSLLFYGRAIKDGTSDEQGLIEYSVNKNRSNTQFSLVSRLATGSAEATQFTLLTQLISEVLTKIVRAQDNVAVGSTTYNNIKWSDYVEESSTGDLVHASYSPISTSSDPQPLGALGIILSDAYITLNTIYATEVRAGSGPAVARMMQDLHATISSVANATATTDQDIVAKAIALQIDAIIGKYLDVDTGKWYQKDKIHANLSGDEQTSFDTAYANLTTDINEFPVAFNIPAGSVSILFDKGTRTYSFPATVPASGMGSGNSFTVYDYMYPAELCYFGNSAIRVSNDSYTTADFPDGSANWIDDSKWSTTTFKNWDKNKHVLSTTHTVAMIDNIQYGTALMKTQVKYGAATLEDNNADIQRRYGATEANNTFDVTSTTAQFVLTGILIGGQDKTVDWQFLPATQSFSQMIYDKEIGTGSAIPSYTSNPTPSNPVYTLVWDNYTTGSNQNEVCIGLEFKNVSGKDFWGKDNLVRNGGYFYLIGKLNPNALDSDNNPMYTLTWPTDYKLPPYGADANWQKQRVFIQDFVTSATFVLGQTSLQSAYVTVPDLRSSQLSLGLSVDLQWSTGLVFGDVILGQ